MGSRAETGFCVKVGAHLTAPGSIRLKNPVSRAITDKTITIYIRAKGSLLAAFLLLLSPGPRQQNWRPAHWLTSTK
jgi:hypothetical protein